MSKKYLLLPLLLLFSLTAQATPIRIVAAENFYGQIAQQLGDPYVQVTSILNNPNQDPHLFSSTPRTAKALANADIIIYNGLDYDPWIENLLATNSQKKHILNIANLLQKKSGDNPHIWYDPHTIWVYAENLTKLLSEIDNIHQQDYHQQLNLFAAKYQQLNSQIKQIKSRYHDTPVIATEPVFNEMATALGLNMQGMGFQLSVMNGTEPSVRDLKDFEEKLKNHSVKVLIFNNQVSNPLTEHLQKLAQISNIPSIGVSESEPVNQDYFTWMSHQLNLLEKALGGR